MGTTSTFSSAMTFDQVLAHHGVKGMKWGVRKDEGHEGEAAKTRKIKSLDKKFDGRSGTMSTKIDIHNRAAELTNRNDIDRINNKPKYKDLDYQKPSKLLDAYYTEHADAYEKNLNTAAAEKGTNASGTKKYKIEVLPNGNWRVTTVTVTHSDASPESYIVRPKMNAKGVIIGVPAMVDTVTHGEPIIQHFGVMGMKWGQHKGGAAEAATSPARKAAPKAAPDSADVKRVSKSAAKVDAHGTRVLTNQELQDLVNRMNLEQQYSRLASGPSKSTGDDIVKKIFANANYAQLAYKHLNSPLAKAVLKTGKKTVKVGVKVATSKTAKTAAGTALALL